MAEKECKYFIFICRLRFGFLSLSIYVNAEVLCLIVFLSLFMSKRKYFFVVVNISFFRFSRYLCHVRAEVIVCVCVCVCV